TFAYLRQAIQSVYPTAASAPYIQSSCTDARHFALICPHTNRFAGFLFRGEQRGSIHGKDENLDVESFKRGVGFYIKLIANLDKLRG
ncbi:MAG: M20/M25/M40 family metallo-hydrolase, partial [Coriobacteriales bacterium]|nr:M20/M25/M40 family metallo-hydrolase [Coriobacteriales bacterium]